MSKHQFLIHNVAVMCIIIFIAQISLLSCYSTVNVYNCFFQAQIVLLGALLIAIANFVIGTFIPPSDEKLVKGVVGYRGKRKLLSLSTLKGAGLLLQF